MVRLTLGLLVAGALAPVYGAIILNESFNNITTLPGAGWVQTNNSVPLGTTGWFQGNTAIFSSNSGAANAYIAANLNNTDPNGGAISNWLITPVLGLTNLTTLTFFARSPGVADGFPDKIEVRLNKIDNTANVGANATSLGNFTDLLLTVNPVLGAWTQYTVNVGAVSGNVSGRLAFRYTIPDVTTAGDYIGIDDVVVNNGVPEPSSISLMCGGLLALYGFVRSAKSKRNEVNS